MSAYTHKTANTYLEPLTDTGFKILFGRESSSDILIGFLNAVLDGEGRDPIVSIRYLDREKTRNGDEERSIHYDIHCETESGHRFIVEMQNRQQINFKKRTMYYVSRAITEQGKHGDWDYDFMPVYIVALTQFVLDEGNTEVKVQAELRDMQTNEQFSDCLRLIYIQLPNFHKTVEECKTDFDCWVYLMKHLRDMNTIPFVQEIFRRVDQVARVENLSPEDRREYERDLKFTRDYRNTIRYAEVKAHEKGLQKGLEKGLEKGLQKGRLEGLQEERRKLVMSMLTNGLDIDMISKFTGLSQDEVEEIVKDSL